MRGAPLFTRFNTAFAHPAKRRFLNSPNQSGVD